MTTFGVGDYGGYNDWAFSGTGVGTFPINWNTSLFATGVLGRITAIAARWDYYTGLCASANGQNEIWDTSQNKVQNTVAFAASASGAGTSQIMHNSACTDVWQNNASYYIGYVRDGAACSIHSWKDNTNGGYAGKSGSDASISGGTVNWGGTVNGGLPVYGTVTDTNIYVKRAGAWGKVFVYVKRSGVWNTTPSYVYVKRAGTWTLLNELKEHEIPHNGEEAMVDVGDGLMPVWIVEEGEVSWFGSEDPTVQPWDWKKPGHYNWERKPWTGKYNSHEPEEIGYSRLQAMYEWDKALRWENYQEANKWYRRFQPSTPLVEKRVLVPTFKIENDPEPIMLGCGCGV